MVKQILQPGMLVFVDTAPFIYFLEQHSEYHAKMTSFLDTVYANGIQMVTSAITLTEICTVPFRKGMPAMAARYREYFTNSEMLHLRVVDALVAEEAARLRAKYSLRTPDALQLATAHVSGADLILTNDLAWQSKTKTKVVTLSMLP